MEENQFFAQYPFRWRSSLNESSKKKKGFDLNLFPLVTHLNAQYRQLSERDLDEKKIEIL